MAPAALAAVAAALALFDLGSGLARAAGARGPRTLRTLAALAEALVRVGREGRDPGAAERRRLLLGGALVAFAAGWMLGGPVAGLALAAGGPWAVARLL